MLASVPLLLPGVALALALALPAKLLERAAPLVPAVVVALALGLVLANGLPLGTRFHAGARWCVRYLLRAAIVLLGAGLSFTSVLRVGGQTLGLVLVCVATAFGLAWLVGRGLRLPGRIAVLIGAGTAICGASAIVACAPLVEAREEETAYALVTVFAFNLVAVLVYPAVGAALALTPAAFGVWAGTAVNDTAAAVATGYAYGDAAGATATVVKLTRTVLLVPLALLLALGARAGGGRGKNGAPGAARAARPLVGAALGAVPWFVLGFLALATLNTAGVITPALARAATETAKVLLVVVLAGVGLSANLGALRRFGPRPLLAGCLAAAGMAALSLVLVETAGPPGP